MNLNFTHLHEIACRLGEGEPSKPACGSSGWLKVDGKLVYNAEPKPTETDEREPEVPVTSDATAAQQASAPEPSKPVADAADDAADAPALAVAESF